MLEINTVNKAISQHTRAYKSMCRFGDTVIAATTTGLVSLGGYADCTTQIHAHVKSGDLDLRTSRLKWFRFFYFEVELDGKLKLSLYCDGDLVNEIEVNSDDGRQQTIRVSTSKIKSGLLWSWKLENLEGVFFVLHSVKCLPVIGRTLKYANRG